MAGFSDKLKRLNKAFKAAKPAESRSGFAPVPDGTYYVKVERAAVEETKKEPKVLVSNWRLKIIEGPHKNRMLFTNYRIGDPKYGQMNMEFLKRDLAIMGIDAADLLNAHEEALDSVLEVKAYTKPGSRFQNVYINNLLDAPEGEESEEEEMEEEEEELPSRPKKKAKKAKKAPKKDKPAPEPATEDDDTEDEDDGMDDFDLDGDDLF